jgi:selenide,water dikinase
VDPKRVLTNAGAQRGDVLVFTKRLGTGVISTALKKGIAAEEHMQLSIDQMLTLNRAAGEAMSRRTVHGCTDVTGFGLLGHAREMALASNVTLEIHASRLRYLPGALEYSAAGAHSGGLNNNRDFVSDCVSFTSAVPTEIEALLYDPQTSGGLLISLPEPEAAALMDELPGSYLIGRVTARGRKPIEVQV